MLTLSFHSHPLPGSVGYDVLQSKDSSVTIGGQKYEVKCKVSKISFSAHTDSVGIVSTFKKLVQGVEKLSD
jgi:Cft2 family RNA processing exonuclease